MAFNFADKIVEDRQESTLIVDALNLAFRWKHQGRSDFRYEFQKTVQSLAQSYKCKDLIITADWGSSTYRKNLCPDYKQNRKEKFAEHSNTMSASFFVATVHSRMDAGILEYEDVSELVELVNDYLGHDVVEKLRAIADEFRAHTMHSLADPMLYDLARKWAEIVQEVA